MIMDWVVGCRGKKKALRVINTEKEHEKTDERKGSCGSGNKIDIELDRLEGAIMIYIVLPLRQIHGLRHVHQKVHPNI